MVGCKSVKAPPNVFYTVSLEKTKRSLLGDGVVSINKGESVAMVVGFVAGVFMALSFLGGRELFFVLLGIVVLLFVVGGVVFHYYDDENDTVEESTQSLDPNN
jgi:hypothetical protein